MADKVKVMPTPIQRNELDVATELTQLYFRDRNGTVEEIQSAFLSFAVAAAAAGIVTYNPRDFTQFLPEELQTMFK